MLAMDSRTVLYSRTVMRIWDHWHTDLSVPPWIHFEPLQLLKILMRMRIRLDLNADMDPNPAFHSDVDPNPNSAFQSDADPCKSGSGSATLVQVILAWKENGWLSGSAPAFHCGSLGSNPDNSQRSRRCPPKNAQNSCSFFGSRILFIQNIYSPSQAIVYALLQSLVRGQTVHIFQTAVKYAGLPNEFKAHREVAKTEKRSTYLSD